MSMHLARGLTTTSTRKRKTKITKSQQEEFERGWRERNLRLKEIHLPKETFEQYMEWLHGTGGKTKKKETNRANTSSTSTVRYPIGSKEISSTEKTKHNKVQDGNGKDTVQVSRPSNWVTGPCTTKPSPVYTGTKIIGIGTMHKSNAVPIFSDEEAKDISTMRR